MNIKGICILFALLNVVACAQVPIELRVHDNEGNAVSDAAVSTGFSSRGVRGITDENGRFLFVGAPSESLGAKIEKSGYYTSFGELWIGSQSDPIPPNQFIVKLRKIENPVANMIYHKIDTELPVLDKPVGFDLLIGDWVAPYGNGKLSDVLISGSRRIDGNLDFEGELLFHFLGEGNGVQEFYALNPKDTLKFSSTFIAPYDAPVSGYKESLRHRIFRNSTMNEHYAKEGRNYIFRIRTITNGDKIAQANYGWIYGEIDWGVKYASQSIPLKLQYFINPSNSPVDRSLEPSNPEQLR